MTIELKDGDDLLIPVSSIQHYSFCPRQFYFMYIEQTFEDNYLTIAGMLDHKNVNSQTTTWNGRIKIERSLDIFNDDLCLIGKTDVVEFHPDGTVYPIEYKHGKRHKWIHDYLQLCAQALCLEKMLNVTINKGAIYYTSTKRRKEVLFDDCLRQQTINIIYKIKELYLYPKPPSPINDKRCLNCSIIDVCNNNLKEVNWCIIFENLFNINKEELNTL